MATLTVTAATQRRETLFFLLAIIALIGAAVALLRQNAARPQKEELLDWQVSAFHDLGPTDQAIYNALEVAGEEVFYVQYVVGDWPGMQELYDFYLPPFYRDKSWEQWGEVDWSMKNIAASEEKTGSIAYHGSGGKIPGQSSYLLVVTHTHAGNSGADAYSIWMNPEVNSPMPEVIKKKSLIRNGWRQVVPYTGDLERKRLKGE